MQATIDVCEDDWDQVGEADFCERGPYDFKAPLYAGYIAIAHVRKATACTRTHARGWGERTGECMIDLRAYLFL